MKHWKAGAYLRLSKEDEKESSNDESLSIANQRDMIITHIAKSVDIELIDIYVDDGFTGTNFNRPSFKRMKKDLDSGIIDCVITKDLSRLGREHIQVDSLIEQYFPENGIRYIAIADNIDTINDVDDFVAIRNIFNEFYPKDISKKVRTVFKNNQQAGKYMGAFASYGYVKSDEDKHQLVVDDFAANVVRYIYDKYLQGLSGRAIADLLNERNILAPSAYRDNYKGNVIDDKHLKWGSSQILHILHDEVYIGNLIQNKRAKISYKSKVRRKTLSAELIKVENTHEAIIDLETWDAVQKLCSNNKHASSTVNKYMFSGLLYCADCNSKLNAGTTKSGRKRYRCYNYTNKNACTNHTVYEEDIIVTVNDLLFTLYNIHNEQLINDIVNYANSNQAIKAENAKTQIKDIELNIDNYKTIIQNLYEDKINGTISQQIFCELSKDYQQKLEILLTERAKYEKLYVNYNIEYEKVKRWCDIVVQCYKQGLSREMLYLIIDKIYVADDATCKVKFKYIGQLEVFLQSRQCSKAS